MRLVRYMYCTSDMALVVVCTEFIGQGHVALNVILQLWRMRVVCSVIFTGRWRIKVSVES